MRAAANLHVVGKDGTVTRVAAGAEIPEDVAEYVTNPAAIDDGEGDDGPLPPADELAEHTNDELRSMLAERGEPTSGTKDELVERLRSTSS